MPSSSFFVFYSLMKSLFVRLPSTTRKEEFPPHFFVVVVVPLSPFRFIRRRVGIFVRGKSFSRTAEIKWARN